MRKEYKIIKNFESANTETSYFGKYDKEGKTRINPTEPFYQTIAYSRRLFYSEDYISHAGFINIKRILGKFKFRFSVHSDYDGIGESYFEDCQVDIEKRFLKLRGFFSTPSGIIQLKETLEFVLKNNENLKLKAEPKELEEFEYIVEVLEKELKKLDEVEPEFYQGTDQKLLEITGARNKQIKRGRIYFKRKGIICNPKFKTLENLADFIKLKEEQEEVEKSVFYFNGFDIESELGKKLLNLNNVSIYIKEFKREHSFSYENEIIISDKENGYATTFEDESCTFCGNIGEKKITVISSFPYMYDKEKREKCKIENFKKSKEIFKRISELINSKI